MLEFPPITNVTANAVRKGKKKRLAARIDNHLSQPINVNKLKWMLSGWIRFPKKIPDLHQEVPVDLSNIRSYSEGNKEEERHFVQLFFGQNTKAIAILKANCAGGKNTSWTEAAHLLKGGAASIGAAHLFTLCDKAQGQANVTEKERRRQLAAIEAEIQRIKDFLILHDLIS